MSSVEVGLDDPHAVKQFQNAPGGVKESLRRQVEILRRDPQTGTYISIQTKVYNKKTVPRWEARLERELHNLRKLDLPNGWRALYTTVSEGPSGQTIVWILELVDHNEYCRLLGY